MISETMHRVFSSHLFLGWKAKQKNKYTTRILRKRWRRESLPNLCRKYIHVEEGEERAAGTHVGSINKIHAVANQLAAFQNFDSPGIDGSFTDVGNGNSAAVEVFGL
ncbi:hypothetical protein CDAR_59071 [Caerostris darwini]|uniref:Uncharacterized protein n=1 Tax=Caerostris darwini TaxID=1538125 RepID=A0AAV4X4X6_9ARAC|nr:hypothetical protein CDAR_59071 [Caerostris darwini]